MKIELPKGDVWIVNKVRIHIYQTDRLVEFDGYIEGHKIVEVEPLNEKFCAVKTTNWE